MIDKPNKYIIFYAVSINHIKNFKILKRKLNKFKFFFIYEENLTNPDNNFNKENLQDFNIINYHDLNEFLNIYKKNIECIIMSTAQVRFFPIKIVCKFINYNIKIISFQETHQIYLHNKNFNNYILPLDTFFVNSDFEKKYLTINDNNLSNLIVNKWPFLEQHKKSTSLKNVHNKKILLILNPTSLNNSNTSENIKFQINLIKNIFLNLPKNCQLYIKPHPVELSNFLVNYFKKEDNIIFKFIDIIKLISVSDLVISSGYTQAIIESILNNKKTLIVPSPDNQNLLSDYKDILWDFKKIPLYLSQKFNIEDHSIFFKKLNIDNIYSNSTHIFHKNFDELKHINIFKTKFDHLTQLFLWSLFIAKKNLALDIFESLEKFANKDQFKFLKIYKLMLESKIFSNDFMFLIVNISNYKILIPLIELFKRFLIKNDIFLSESILNAINKNINPRYFDDLFFLDNQSFANYLLYKGNKKLAIKLILKYRKDSKNIINSKSLKFRIYLKFRDFNAFYGFGLFNKINFYVFNRFINIIN